MQASVEIGQKRKHCDADTAMSCVFYTNPNSALETFLSFTDWVSLLVSQQKHVI